MVNSLFGVFSRHHTGFDLLLFIVVSSLVIPCNQISFVVHSNIGITRHLYKSSHYSGKQPVISRSVLMLPD